MASIQKLSNGTYRARIYVGRDGDGKQMFRSVTRDGWKECRKAARELEQEISEGKLTNIGNMRITAWAEEYIKISRESYAPATRSLYRCYLRKHYKPYFKNMKMGQLNDIHVKKFKNYLLENMAASSAQRCMSAFKKIIKEGLKDRAPTKDVPVPKANKSKAKAPTREEFQKIWDASKGTELEVKILLAGWCSLRRGEVLALKPDDFNFEAGTVRVDESTTMDEKEVILKKPKSDNSYRVEVVPPYLLALVKNLIKKRSQGKVVSIAPSGKDWRLFGGRPDTLTTNFSRFIKRHKLPKYTFHDLRHYHATWLYDAGIPDLYAAKRMGHSVDTLKNIYQHLGLDRQRELEKRILEIENPLT